MTLNTSDPVGSRSCMSGPYVGLCGSLHAEHTEPLYLRPTEAKLVAGLVSQQAITAPKLGQFTIFSAMKRHCCCQHCFLREGMRRQWEWNRAMLYKEDYKDKTTLTSLKFEDTSRETRRLSKSSCLLEGWQLAVFSHPRGYDEQDRNTDIEFYLWSQKLTLDRKGLLKVAAIYMQNKASLLLSRGRFLSLQHGK